MGCCVGSQKVEINERNYSPDSSSKESSESPQEQTQEEHSNNKDVDSGYDEKDFSKQARTSTPRKPTQPTQSTTPRRTPRKYKTIDAVSKVYQSNPAFMPAVKNHPDIKRLTPRESTDRFSWASPRTLENIPENHDSESRSDIYRGNSLLSSRGGEDDFTGRPRTMHTSRGSPRRPTTRDSVDTTVTSVSRASVTGVQLGILTESLASNVPWDINYDSYARTPSRQNRKSSVEVRMSELERRYKRSKPAGYSRRKRQKAMKERMRKQAISLDNGAEASKSKDENESLMDSM